MMCKVQFVVCILLDLLILFSGVHVRNYMYGTFVFI
jgi:hypothetical protein